MTIVTKTGDDGKSRFLNRAEDKDRPLLEAIGAIDELMAVIGIVSFQVPVVAKITDKINKELYYLSGYLVGYNQKIDFGESVKLLEQDIKKMEEEMPRLKEFLTPGEQLNIWFNWARVVCRRTERRIVALNKVQPLEKNILKFINRLSDYLFMLGRQN